MLQEYAGVFLFSVLSIGFIFITLFLGKLIRPHRPNALKNMPYECGEIPTGHAWVNFNIRYYVLALIFLLFDVEVALILPVASVYKEWLSSGLGLMALIELLLFVGILIVALVYSWGRGDLNWVKSYVHQEKVESSKSSE